METKTYRPPLFASRVPAGFPSPPDDYIREVNGHLGISPVSLLDDEQRDWVSANKPAILAALKLPGTEIGTGQGGHVLAAANCSLSARLAIAPERRTDLPESSRRFRRTSSGHAR